MKDQRTVLILTIGSIWQLMLTQVCIVPSFDIVIYITPHYSELKNKTHMKTGLREKRRMRSDNFSLISNCYLQRQYHLRIHFKGFSYFHWQPQDRAMRTNTQNSWKSVLGLISWEIFCFSSQPSKGRVCLQGNLSKISNRFFNKYFFSRSV